VYADWVSGSSPETCANLSTHLGYSPNNVQATHLARAAGVARFPYNRALAAGFERHLKKPVRLDELERALDEPDPVR
jgi:hypothetical protein